MARLGTLRVSDVLDYERDIEGKRLVRFRAGVGAGKNYWVRHLPEQYPAAAERQPGGELLTIVRIHTNKLQIHRFAEYPLQLWAK